MTTADQYEREWAAKGFPNRRLPAPPSPTCRTGCKTQDHPSYAACLKAAALQIGRLR